MPAGSVAGFVNDMWQRPVVDMGQTGPDNGKGGRNLLVGPDQKVDNTEGKSTGVPIDHYSYEAVELLKDISARWDTARRLRNLAGCDVNKDAPVCAAIRVPQAKIYAIDVSFPALQDKAERDYLNQQPTTFVLPPEAVDRLRAAAGTIIAASPEFQRMLKDAGVKIVGAPTGAP